MAVSLFGIPGNDVNRSLLLLVNEYYHNTDTTLVNGITDPEHDKTIVVAHSPVRSNNDSWPVVTSCKGRFWITTFRSLLYVKDVPVHRWFRKTE